MILAHFIALFKQVVYYLSSSNQKSNNMESVLDVIRIEEITLVWISYINRKQRLK